MKREKGRRKIATGMDGVWRHLVLLAVFTTPAWVHSQVTKHWSLEEIFSSSQFRTKSLSAVEWVDGGRRLSYLELDTTDGFRDLWVYTASDGKREMVMDGGLLTAHPGEKPMRVASYEWSSDYATILVTGSLPARRTKTGGNFGVFHVAEKQFRMLTDSDQEQSIIRFSPDGSRVGFVRANNLFVVDLGNGEEKQLTFDGSATVLNGKFDWVYEEEFSIIDGWEWSPDGKRIAFWRLDQSAVPEFPLVRYPVDKGQPEIEFMRYPKAGDPNSLVQIGVAEVSTGKITWMDLGAGKDIYVPRLKWTNNPQVLSIQRLNRGQDTLDLMLANVDDGTTTVILSETDTAWIDVENGGLVFLERSERFLWTSFRDGFMHIYLYRLDGTLEQQVTSGFWEVTDIAGVDERRETIFFLSTEVSPLDRHLFSIRFDGSGKRRLTPEPGRHSINMSPDRLVFLDTYSNVDTPSKALLRTNDGTIVSTLVENTTEMFQGYRFGEFSFLTVPTSDGEKLNAWMIRPQDFDPKKRYPVLLYVYGGPGSQTVTNSWGGARNLWYHLLAEKGYIVASVDNRGTGARGKAFMQQTHNRLGLREVDDFVETARYLSGLSYVDSTRIGIWGWSGGGYMTCLAMTYGAGHFKTGIAVAPVTSWRYYDTIYTERYMDTPQNNPEGYRLTSALSYADRMNGKLLIVHGTTDDNVHWQNTITLVDELIRQNKKVYTMFYPGRAHGISGGNTTLHLYTMLTEFLLENL